MALSDRILVMRLGVAQQIGTPTEVEEDGTLLEIFTPLRGAT
jgi:ABC-type sugar transport system ATPase subunit